MEKNKHLMPEEQARITEIQDLLIDRYVEQKEALCEGNRCRAIELEFEIKELLHEKAKVREWEAVRRGKIRALGMALSLAVGIFAESAAALAVDPQNNVRGFYDTLLTTMKEGHTLAQSGRYGRLAPVVDRVFDVPFMTRLAVGPSWDTLSPAQQQQLTEAFRHYIAATYADRFDSYSGQQLQVIGERPYNADVIVQTRIVKSDGETTTLNYLMRQNQGSWRISDVYLDGTISQVAIQRSEFHSILRRDGVDGLVMALTRKVDLLGRGVAKAS